MNESGIDAAAKALLGKFSAEESPGVDPLVQKALFLASELQKRAHALQTPEERKQQTELDRMIQNPTDKVTLTALTDQAFRSEAAARSAARSPATTGRSPPPTCIPTRCRRC